MRLEADGVGRLLPEVLRQRNHPERLVFQPQEGR